MASRSGVFAGRDFVRRGGGFYLMPVGLIRLGRP